MVTTRVDAFLDWICSDSVSESSHKRFIPPTPAVDEKSSHDAPKPSKRHKTSPQLFLTNLPFSTTQQSLRSFLEEKQIPFESLHLGLDALGKFQGWCLIFLSPSSDPPSLLPVLDGAAFQDRVLYASLEKNKINFRLPCELIARLRAIKDERSLSGCPAGRMADGYRRVFGEKFPAERYGFRTFAAALQSIPGLSLALDSRTNQTILTWP